jgi:UDP-N-acetyl-D-mannosaminuronate dehydrogenase
VTDLASIVCITDCLVIATDHTDYDWLSIAHQVPVIVDTRHALNKIS